ncbi:hypothetical protein PsorP6_004870 [Peronosclerospora sorghi]|uniref:Uncharacterized protein n=1 Tax=Peronosclerospora sorghi TaxID=230839 RepID=A0ACC0W768_9STRA|nr:hypothetical protein PsorP6_004870 [Peronosclerospora sorghi]
MVAVWKQISEGFIISRASKAGSEERKTTATPEIFEHQDALNNMKCGAARMHRNTEKAKSSRLEDQINFRGKMRAVQFLWKLCTMGNTRVWNTCNQVLFEGTSMKRYHYISDYKAEKSGTA